MADQSSPAAGMYMSTVRIGPKGQIVIPKEVRQLYDIQPGDSLFLLADRDRGVVLVPQSQYQKMMDLFTQAFSLAFPPEGKSS